jgi:hypothetical protein
MYVNYLRHAAHLLRCASAIRLRPTGVLGPVESLSVKGKFAAHFFIFQPAKAPTTALPTLGVECQFSAALQT